MATAKQFLDAIELEKLVPNDLLDELYEEYRASGGAVTADTLATRLVSSGALPQSKADQLLQSSSDSFIQVGSGVLEPKQFKETGPEDPFDEALESKRAKKGEKRDAVGRRKHVKKTHKNDFDSPLLMIGGGILALLVLGGLGLAVVMNLQSGDQLLESAQTAYASGSYSQAREEYEQFVEDFAGNARWSEARVKLAVVRLRQLTETSRDWDRALAVAQEEIPQVEDEPAFSENRGEFASLLPRVARGLAEQADAASDKVDSESDEHINSLVSDAEAALTLVSNTKYVPKSLRDDRELGEIRDLLDRVARRREAVADLTKTLAAINAATAAGDVPAAYAAQAEFVSRRPELRDDQRLKDELAAAVEAERQLVKFVDDRSDAATAEPDSPVALALPLANPRRTGQADSEGMFTGQFHGVLYAVKAADGALAWRRPVGTRLVDTPAVTLAGDLLVLDHRRGELVRLKAATGDLVWRTVIEGPDAALFAPVVAGDRVLVASEAGRLWSFDTASGSRSGYAQFAQPLRAAPAFDPDSGKLYVVGEQSSLYTLDSGSLACESVRYTGHAAGAVVTAPLAIGGRVVLVENTGAETSQMNVFATDSDGAVSNQIGDWRLDGIVAKSPVANGRRVLVATESGAVYVFDVTASQEGPPVSLVASQAAQRGPTQSRRVVEARNDVWIAGEGLRRTAASLADSQLVARDLPDPCDGDLFVGPLVRNGGAVLHTRLRQGTPGVTFGATDARSGQLVWETDLGTPPLGPPALSSNPRGVVTSGLSGQTHLLGPQEIRARLSAQPFVQPTRSGVYDGVARLEDGATVLTREGAAEWLAVRLFPRAAARGASLPDDLACVPVPMGEGLLTPLSVGQIHLLDLTGQPVATPWQPQVTVGRRVAWTQPAVATAGRETLAVLSDGAASVYCLSLEAGSTPALKLRGSHELKGEQPTTAAAIAGQRAVVGLSGGKVAVFSLPEMGAPSSLALPGEIAWGPYAAGRAVLIATESQLLALDVSAAPRIAWQVDLAGGVPKGEPLPDGDAVLLVTTDGALSRRTLATGSETTRLDLGEPAGSGAIAYGPRLLVTAADGSVLVINKP